MGKYTIEIHDAFVEDCGVKKLLLPVKLNECGSYYLPTGITLIPYTEPDMERVRKEAYEKGLSDGKNQDAKDFADMYDSGYSEGLKDAWECADRIFDMTCKRREQIFSKCNTFGVWDILRQYTASEALEEIRAHEQAQKEEEEQEEKDSITAEEVMRQYLDAFCKRNFCTGCPLHTPDFTCGRGYHFLTHSRISNEEVRRAYVEVLAKMKE